MSGNCKPYGAANPNEFDAFNLVARVSCPKDVPDKAASAGCEPIGCDYV
jgi:hypothetical protein